MRKAEGCTKGKKSARGNLSNASLGCFRHRFIRVLIFCPRSALCSYIIVSFRTAYHIDRLTQWNHLLSRVPSSANMISFIEHCSFPLKAFTVGGCQHFYNQLHGILSLLPSLDFLKLHFRHRNRSLTDELLNRLCASDESSPFLPRLRTLVFTPQLTFPWESLPQIFFSPTRQSLRVKVDQHTDTLIPDEDAERLLELVDTGFNLSILRDGKVDVLEEYREKRRLSQTTQQ